MEINQKVNRINIRAENTFYNLANWVEIKKIISLLEINIWYGYLLIKSFKKFFY